MSSSIREMAHALGGDVAGGQLLCPGPGHSARDRSLSVRLSASSPDGFLAHSHAGDDWRVCRDYVRSRLGIDPDGWKRKQGERTDLLDNIQEVKERPTGNEARRIKRALEIWDTSIDPRGTLAEVYLNSRALGLDADIAGSVLRFHARCPWRDKENEPPIFVPAMIAIMRSIATDEITAIQRTFGFGYGGYRLGPGYGYYGGGGISLILVIVLILLLTKVI